jgi:hypothetical protein
MLRFYPHSSLSCCSFRCHIPEPMPLSNLGMRRVYTNASMLLGRRIKLCRSDQLQYLVQLQYLG